MGAAPWFPAGLPTVDTHGQPVAYEWLGMAHSSHAGTYYISGVTKEGRQPAQEMCRLHRVSRLKAGAHPTLGSTLGQPQQPPAPKAGPQARQGELRRSDARDTTKITPPPIDGTETLTECPSGRRPGDTLAADTRDTLPPHQTLCPRGAVSPVLAHPLLPSVLILRTSKITKIRYKGSEEIKTDPTNTVKRRVGGANGAGQGAGRGPPRQLLPEGAESGQLWVPLP